MMDDYIPTAYDFRYFMTFSPEIRRKGMLVSMDKKLALQAYDDGCMSALFGLDRALLYFGEKWTDCGYDDVMFKLKYYPKET